MWCWNWNVELPERMRVLTTTLRHSPAKRVWHKTERQFSIQKHIFGNEKETQPKKKQNRGRNLKLLSKSICTLPKRTHNYKDHSHSLMPGVCVVQYNVYVCIRGPHWNNIQDSFHLFKIYRKLLSVKTGMPSVNIRIKLHVDVYTLEYHGFDE